MLDTSTYDLKGQRVRVTLFGGDTVEGILKGVHATRLFIGEAPVQRADIAEIEAAPLFCRTCLDSVAVLHDELCASCYRKEAKRKPPVREPCAVCLTEGVTAPGIRNPGTDEFLCMRHHAQKGNNPRLTVGNAAALADCATEDTSSDKHVWQQVRGARFRCIRCQKAEKYDPELLKELRK